MLVCPLLPFLVLLGVFFHSGGGSVFSDMFAEVLGECKNVWVTGFSDGFVITSEVDACVVKNRKLVGIRRNNL